MQASCEPPFYATTSGICIRECWTSAPTRENYDDSNSNSDIRLTLREREKVHWVNPSVCVCDCGCPVIALMFQLSRKFVRLRSQAAKSITNLWIHSLVHQLQRAAQREFRYQKGLTEVAVRNPNTGAPSQVPWLLEDFTIC